MNEGSIHFLALLKFVWVNRPRSLSQRQEAVPARYPRNEVTTPAFAGGSPLLQVFFKGCIWWFCVPLDRWQTSSRQWFTHKKFNRAHFLFIFRSFFGYALGATIATTVQRSSDNLTAGRRQHLG